MIEAFIKGITIGLLLSISVGPVMFSVIKQSLNNGHKGGMSFIVGVAFSDLLLVLVSNVFTELFSSISEFKKEIGIAGSVFLIALGLYFIFFKKVKVNEEGKQDIMKFRKRDYLKIFLSGFFMNTLNPAVFIFWLTASTAFIANSINERIVIFLTCLALVFASDIAKVMLAGKIRKKMTVHNIGLINRFSGMILVGFGITLIWGLIFYANKLN
jgi:threonine/homoserine/homoserine lactone efflux protein